MRQKKNYTRALVESAIMVALATVLSILKLAEMPYGGSITPASMLPIIIVAYRHGTLTGLGAGLVHGVIQQLLGLNTLGYFTTWQSIVAIILLDYILAFGAAGLGGIFRGRIVKDTQNVARCQSAELGTGALLVCLLRYVMHTVSGCTVWAGLSIPTEAALVYSLVYNATYMIPETIICFSVTVWLGSMIDFGSRLPRRISRTEADEAAKYPRVYDFLAPIATFFALVAIVVDTVLIFPYLQDAESGEFTFAAMGDVSWVAVAVVTAICVLLAAAALIARRVIASAVHRRA